MCKSMNKHHCINRFNSGFLIITILEITINRKYIHIYIPVFSHRETKKDGRTERISIETNYQLELELPSILYGKD